MNAAWLTLCLAGICGAQPGVTVAQSSPIKPQHFRLTFVLSYPAGEQPSQSFMLDVPVLPGKPGMSRMSLAAGIPGDAESGVEENLQCTDVHKSAAGLAFKVAFTMHSLAPPLPNSQEPLHHQLTFDKQVDLILDKPTLITEEMHVIPLKQGDNAAASTLPAAPQITITAVEI